MPRNRPPRGRCRPRHRDHSRYMAGRSARTCPERSTTRPTLPPGPERSTRGGAPGGTSGRTADARPLPSPPAPGGSPAAARHAAMARNSGPVEASTLTVMCLWLVAWDVPCGGRPYAIPGNSCRWSFHGKVDDEARHVRRIPACRAGRLLPSTAALPGRGGRPGLSPLRLCVARRHAPRHHHRHLEALEPADRDSCRVPAAGLAAGPRFGAGGKGRHRGRHVQDAPADGALRLRRPDPGDRHGDLLHRRDRRSERGSRISGASRSPAWRATAARSCSAARRRSPP